MLKLFQANFFHQFFVLFVFCNLHAEKGFIFARKGATKLDLKSQSDKNGVEHQNLFLTSSTVNAIRTRNLSCLPLLASHE